MGRYHTAALLDHGRHWGMLDVELVKVQHILQEYAEYLREVDLLRISTVKNRLVLPAMLVTTQL